MGFLRKTKIKYDDLVKKKLPDGGHPPYPEYSNNAAQPFELGEGNGCIVHAPIAANNNISDLERARHKTKKRELEEQSMISPTVSRHDSFISAVSPRYSEAPEVVTHGMRSPSLSNESLTMMMVPTRKPLNAHSRPDQLAHPPTQQPAATHPPNTTATTAMLESSSAAVTLAQSLPWDTITTILSQHSQNPGLLILPVIAFYAIYSIILNKALYLLIAFIVGILVVNGRKTFIAQKQAEVQGEYFRCLSTNGQPMMMLSQDAGPVSNKRMIMPAGMQRVEEILD